MGPLPAFLFSTITFKIVFIGLVFESDVLLQIGFVVSLLLAFAYSGLYLRMPFGPRTYTHDIPFWFQVRFILPSYVYFMFVCVGMAAILDPGDENLHENGVMYRDFIYYWTLTFQLICLVIIIWTPYYTMVDDRKDATPGPEDTLKDPLLLDKDLGVEIV